MMKQSAINIIAL